MYVIINNGKYIARFGQKSSYTTNLQHAQIFTTLAEAEENKCDNETIRDLTEVVSRITAR